MDISPDLQHYMADHILPEEDFLKELERETHFKSLYGRMVSGHLQGKILYMLCRMIKPRRVLELGTFTGYSAICMALALDGDAQLHTIEINDELESLTRRYFKKAGVEDRIHLHIGDALSILPELEEEFDLVFIDANKRDYPAYYEAVFDKIKPGGFILADNILWDGKVIDPKELAQDPQTRGVVAFNTRIRFDRRVENVILPIRDGLSIIRKLDNPI